MRPTDLDSALASVRERYRPSNKVGPRRDWWRVDNKAHGADATDVYLFDEISWFGVSADDFRQAIADIDGDITLHLNSPGGDVFDGMAIFSTLRHHDGDVSVIIDGLAASIASVIAMSGSTRTIITGAMMMIHEAWGLSIGPASEHRALSDLLDKISGNIADVFAERATGDMDADGWRELMLAETWFTADEALAAGLVHGIADPDADKDDEADNGFDLSVFSLTDPPAPDTPSTNGDGFDPADFLRAIREAVPTS